MMFMVLTPQEQFWQSNFGQQYSDRNNYTDPQAIDQFYINNIGVSRSDLNKEFLFGLSINNIFEAGCNIGNQLNLLQSQGYSDLYGIDIQPYAVEMAKQYTKNINIIDGSIFDIPFKDNYFDLVFTSGVLIHISPDDLPKALRELYRVSKKYILCYEYFNEDQLNVNYRGNDERLWKGNFSKMFLDLFPDLKLRKENIYKYLKDDNRDTMFILEKK